jgi:hypothetical protein
MTDDATRASDTREAFELVGNATRADILRVLSEARNGGLPPALSFSTLRDRIATDPRSSQFNYHLSELLGTFVERREDGSAQLADEFVTDDDGYALRPSGTFLTRVLHAMSDDGRDVTVEPFDSGFDCHHCGGRVDAEYANRTFQLRCRDCEYLYAYTLTPPGIVADDPDEDTLLSRADHFLRRKFTTFARGTCPLCAGGAPPERVDPAELNWPRADALESLVYRECQHCGNLNYGLVGAELLADPGVLGFLREHGRRPGEEAFWTFAFAVTDEHTTVTSEDPWRAQVAIEPEGETLLVTVDEHNEVVDRERT